MSSIKLKVKKIIEEYPRARENPNICITLYMKKEGIKSVSPSVWGIADSVRRAWRYWINTKKLYATKYEDERYSRSLFFKEEYGKKNRIEV
jgi:hypothetical protein